MSFLDAFQGYHQIPLALDDQEKTVFVTPTGNYHYKVMHFGLKKCRSYLLKDDDQDIRAIIRQKY